MGTRERGDIDSAPGWGSFSPESRANRWAWYVAIGTFFLLVALIVAAMFYRLSTRVQPDADGSLPVAGHMPAGFNSDRSAEAAAFRATCAQCHVLPSPSFHDQAGWRRVHEKMAAQIAARGLEISASQVELAISYAIRHGRSGTGSPATGPSW